jgi:hypothetical protein
VIIQTLCIVCSSILFVLLCTPLFHCGILGNSINFIFFILFVCGMCATHSYIRILYDIYFVFNTRGIILCVKYIGIYCFVSPIGSACAQAYVGSLRHSKLLERSVVLFTTIVLLCSYGVLDRQLTVLSNCRQ